MLRRLPTDIPGLDQLTYGGLPSGRTTVLMGDAGTGKTVFAMQFLIAGVKRGENGVFVTFEETPADIALNVANFGWDVEKMVKDGKIAFVDASPSLEETVEAGKFDLEGFVIRIAHAVKKVNAKRVSIDSISSIFSRYHDPAIVRRELWRITAKLKSLGVTTILTAEGISDKHDFKSRYGIEEFVADNVMVLKRHKGENKVVRSIEIIKMRGLSYRSGEVNFEIIENGIIVYPKIPIDLNLAKTSYKNRVSIGIKKLDEMIGGGIPEGHVILLGGNTGSGKTTIAMQFLQCGFERKESGVYVALEESPTQIKKTALEHGWDFEKAEKRNLLRFVTTGLIDIDPNKLLYNIMNQLEDVRAKLLVLDSVSSLESATLDRNSVRELLIQLTAYAKSKGICVVMTYLTSAMFGAPVGQLMGSDESSEIRLSSIVDGIILTRYVERDQSIRKLIGVLKMRGSPHDNQLKEFITTKRGIEIGDKFKQ